MATEQTPDYLDEATIERLLAGETVVGYGRLTRLLASVQAPGGDAEFVGEDAAVLAFRETMPAAPIPRKLSAHFTRFITIKATALVFAVGLGTGGAIAASTGHLPEGVANQIRDAKTAPQQHHRPAASTPPQPSPRQSPAPGPSQLTQLSGLCTRYNATDRDRRRAALEHESEFRDLINHVGGLDQAKIERFCEDLRKPRPSGVLSWSHHGLPDPTASPPKTPTPQQSTSKRPDNRNPSRTSRPGPGPSKRPKHNPPAR